MHLPLVVDLNEFSPAFIASFPSPCLSLSLSLPIPFPISFAFLPLGLLEGVAEIENLKLKLRRTGDFYCRLHIPLCVGGVTGKNAKICAKLMCEKRTAKWRTRSGPALLLLVIKVVYY